MTPIQAETSLYGWPLIFILASVFIMNFFIARYFTVRLVQNKFIKKNSPEFQKAFLMWFFPIIGALGLCMLLVTFRVIKWWKNFSKWLFLKHA